MVDKDVYHMASRLEPFFDDWLIETVEGASLRLHQPVRREIALEFDRPWEGKNSGSFVSVFPDGDIYRMYYRGSDISTVHPVVCYAESRDGIRWERPDLGIFDHEGYASNNIVWGESESVHDFFAFKDLNPAADDSQRYKAVSNTDRRSWEGGFFGFVSQDGIHWEKVRKEPLLPDDRMGYDGPQGPVFWDSVRGEYLAYLRAWATADGSEVPRFKSPRPKCYRTIRHSRSKDFINWTKPTLIQYDVPLSLEVQHYTSAIMPYPRAPHILIGLPRRFTPLRKKHPDHPSPGLSDGVFITSRDGINWKRWTEAFIRPGLDQMNWVERNNTPAWGVLETAPGELSVYWTEHFHQEGCRLRRGTLRTDGFVSVNAGYVGGEFTTIPLTFEGREVVINYSTSAVGSVRVEIQDSEGRPKPGYALDDCPEIFGDEIEGVVRWKNGAEVGALAGKPVRLRFALKDADLYAFRFR